MCLSHVFVACVCKVVHAGGTRASSMGVGDGIIFCSLVRTSLHSDMGVCMREPWGGGSKFLQSQKAHVPLGI